MILSCAYCCHCCDLVQQDKEVNDQEKQRLNMPINQQPGANQGMHYAPQEQGYAQKPGAHY